MDFNFDGESQDSNVAGDQGIAPVSSFADSLNEGTAVDPATETGAPKQGRLHKRIDQLVKQRGETERAFQAKQAEWAEEKGALMARLDSLESRLSQPTNPQPATSGDSGDAWANATDAQLQQVIEEGGHDAGVTFRVMKELARREAASTSQSVQSALAERDAVQQKVQAAWGEVQTQYGEEAIKPNSELRRAAEIVASSYKKEYGEDVFQRMPNLLKSAYDSAYAHLAGKALPKMQSEMEKLRAIERDKQAGQARVARTSEADAAIKEALGKGDTGAAIRNLDIIGRLRGAS